ncbi:MAG: conserved phage C-terminal domain-containing protein [Syntrophales bacterium]|jgi:uncharacterized phage protein (TIGR02220 family)|nr:conserved phage C-terminal domain-containing protein [Syntrophales bacterium]
MNRGYIRLWRKSLDAGWIKNHKLWVFWTYCLLKATHKEYHAIVGLKAVHLMPGQFVFGLRVASEETGLSVREIRTILAFLKKSENLKIKTTNKYSIITIVNWASYQLQDSKSDTQDDKQRANKGQHTITIEHKKKDILSDSSIPFEEITSYLNEKTGKHFRASTKETRKCISARWKDFPDLKAFQFVIDVKCVQWLNDPQMEPYLRPQTLFGSKFEGYLNETMLKEAAQ